MPIQVVRYLCPVEGCTFVYEHRLDYERMASELIESGRFDYVAVAGALRDDSRATELALVNHFGAHGAFDLVLAGINLTYVKGGLDTDD